MISLSVVMPFYKRFDLLDRTLLRNARCFSPDMELVLVADEPSCEAQVLQLAQSWSAFRWTILINRNDHEWRNPSKPINVGIRNARSDYVLICSPETVWVTDVARELLAEAQKKPTHFHFGEIAFAEPNAITTLEQFRQKPRMGCGSLCTTKENLERVRGYDETLIGWGADDDNVRARLALSKVYGIGHKHVASVHPPMKEKHRFYSKDTAARIKEIVRPTSAEANAGVEWGADFSEILYQT